ncbi:MAG TPA: histidine--tRNA ligase [Blastocatellia bacterium]|nr:histidine--tRNA ligase [Blastocatellia bacterium]
MSSDRIEGRPIPRLPKGLRDTFANDVLARRYTIDKIRRVYENYGFAPLETSAIEYVDTLGKFLPESSTPAGGIFAFQDEDNSWLALRYDLTAPLSRIFSEYRKEIPQPFRRYQVGLVWRNEKPGPGRFREFYQFDIDTVGTPSMAADAEVCCVLADALEALDIARGDYIIKVNNRKALNGVLEVVGISPDDEDTSLGVLRAIDKLDRLGLSAVRELLGKGRLDESGDPMKGANLSEDQIQLIVDLLSVNEKLRSEVCDRFQSLVQGSAVGEEGVAELREIDRFLSAVGYGEDRVVFDPTVVRGLAYYTGPVVEAALTFETTDDETGQKRQFGSVAGGGRYDYLVERFIGEKVPATGASIGVDRLLAALKQLGKLSGIESSAPVVITVMDRNYILEYEKMAFQLRNAGIPAEMYLGSGGFKKQLQYADDRGSVVAVIAGSREFEAGEVSLKDLRLGRELSKNITDRAAWSKEQPAQITVSMSNLVEEVRGILNRYAANNAE